MCNSAALTCACSIKNGSGQIQQHICKTNLWRQDQGCPTLASHFEDSDGGILPLNAMIDGEESVQDDLKTKHLTEETPQPDTLLVSENPANAQMHLVLFERIDEDLICSAALQTHGRTGPSSLDASDCRHLCTSFHTVSDGLCKTLALLARHLCTEGF